MIAKNIKLPETIRQKLMSSYRNFSTDEGFPVWDNTLNVWLSENLGIHTDSPRFEINQSFIVWFDWSIQVWRVK
jgi:hypothetical protein